MSTQKDSGKCYVKGCKNSSMTFVSIPGENVYTCSDHVSGVFEYAEVRKDAMRMEAVKKHQMSGTDDRIHKDEE